MSDNPRILVFTVAAWDNSAEVNTWSSLLAGHDPESVANICIRDGAPVRKNCARFFSISENKVIKSIYNKKIKTGHVVSPKDENVVSDDLKAHNERYRKMQRKRRPSMLLARELVWKLGKWKSDELDAFLDEFNPDIILYSLESYIHLNRIVEYSIKRTGASAIGYIWDDNFTYKQSSGVFFTIHRFFQRRSLKRLVDVSTDFFAITEMTKSEADEFFGIDCKLLTKPLERIPTVSDKKVEQPIKFLYTGSLVCGREETLLKVVDSVRRNRLPIEIDVYTQSDMDPKLSAQLSNSVCRIHTAVSHDAIIEMQDNYDVLLLLEAIDGKYANLSRLSFSSKITDYLSAGKCIFAVGNPDIAPMRYFAKNKSAVIASSSEELDEKLHLIVNDPHVLEKCARNAVASACENHSQEKVLKIFNDTINSAVKEKYYDR